MKKSILILLITVSVLATSFKLATDNCNASVEEVQGLKVFLYSKPASKFDVSGTVKAPLIEKDNIEDRIEVLIKRAKKDFPSAEGIIINHTLQNAEVIRFKE